MLRRVPVWSRVKPQARLPRETRFLQAQKARTNPHSLFNSLNSVMSLIGKDPAGVAR